jgi:hypothetical protein
MINRAIGRFVAHIDDDDWVADSYIERQLAALKSNPDADCASLRGVVTTDGRKPRPFINSMRYTKWDFNTAQQVYERTPVHCNAVRRELALQANFPDTSWAEDLEFSKRLRPLLKTEVSTGEEPLYFYRYCSTKPPGWYYGSRR